LRLHLNPSSEPDMAQHYPYYYKTHFESAEMASFQLKVLKRAFVENAAGRLSSVA